jgi:hypothetical protein
MPVQISDLNSDEQVIISPQNEEKNQIIVGIRSLADDECPQILGGNFVTLFNPNINRNLGENINRNLVGNINRNLINLDNIASSTVMCPW